MSLSAWDAAHTFVGVGRLGWCGFGISLVHLVWGCLGRSPGLDAIGAWVGGLEQMERRGTDRHVYLMVLVVW